MLTFLCKAKKLNLCYNKFVIRLKVKPFSLNKAFYKNRVLNQKAREYREDFLLQLMNTSNQAYLKKIQAEFDQDKNYLAVSYSFYQPHAILFTKKGYISRKSQDLDNCLKLITDFLCNNKYNGRIINDVEIKNLDIDDQFIAELHAFHKCSHNGQYYLHIEIAVKDLLLLRNS